MKSDSQSIAGPTCVAGIGVLFFVLFALPVMADGGPVRTGEQIYRQQCASCHGSMGEGTDDHYPRPLVGERSVAGLVAADRQDDAGGCPWRMRGRRCRESRSLYLRVVLLQIRAGRNKFQIPRIELSRLTVRQYKNAIADLLGSFQQTPGHWDQQRGLKAEYSSRGRRRRNSNGGSSSLNRVDPEIHLDFGTGSPIPEQNALKDIAKSWQRFPVLLVPLSAFSGFSQEFRANWQGSLLAPETGEYEFLVKNGKCHATVGQRQGPATDRRPGQVGQ